MALAARLPLTGAGESMKKLYPILSWALVLVCMTVILLFSSDPASVSKVKSGSIAGTIEPPVNTIVRAAGGHAVSFSSLDHIVRKCAHVFNYFLLGFLCCHAFSRAVGGRRLRRPYLFAWLLATGFSALDEFYQTFVPGRGGQFRDVCVDNIGVVLGILLFLLLAHLRQRARGNIKTR